MFGRGFRPRHDRKYEIAIAVALGLFSGYYIFNQKAQESLTSTPGPNAKAVSSPPAQKNK